MFVEDISKLLVRIWILLCEISPFVEYSPVWISWTNFFSTFFVIIMGWRSLLIIGLMSWCEGPPNFLRWLLPYYSIIPIWAKSSPENNTPVPPISPIHSFLDYGLRVLTYVQYIYLVWTYVRCCFITMDPETPSQNGTNVPDIDLDSQRLYHKKMK